MAWDSMYDNCMIEKSEIAKRIQMAREEMGLNKTELARLSDMSTSHISRLESASSGVSIETLDRIADVLNVSVGWLLGISRSIL